MSDMKKPFIFIENLHYTYEATNYDQTDVNRDIDFPCKPVYALNEIDLSINEGEYVAIVGANGSGKSTLLKHLNALLIPTLGDVWISGWNTRDSSHIRDIRSNVGMVFEVPDTQIVATVVEEDVAFGPENLGIPDNELRTRVDWALEVTGLSKIKHRPSHLLSEGQKQLLAIASTLSMRPRCLVLDECTSMLDPSSRLRIIETIKELHNSGMTIVKATHNMEEAALAQRIIVLSKGCISIHGDARSLFSHEEELKALKLDLPYPARLARRLATNLDYFPVDILTVDELLCAITSALKRKKEYLRGPV